MGWEGYELPHYCKYCRDFYNKEDQHEHKHCDTDTDNADDSNGELHED